MTTFVGLMKERVGVYGDFWDNGYYFFTEVKEYDPKTVRKKWKSERLPLFQQLRQQLHDLGDSDAAFIKTTVISFMEANSLGFGDVLPILRVGVTGTMQGPDIFAVMALLGAKEVDARLERAYAAFELG